jgi:peptide subunit release factor 1 (eRF1)
MLTAETVDRIVRFNGQSFNGRGLPVTSVYACVEADPGLREDLQVRVSSMLDQIRPLAKNGSAGHEARLSVRADIQRINQALAEERWRPAGVAIFACSGAGLYEEVTLPRPVRDQVTVDTAPYVRPMLAVLDELHRACVVIVDKADARIWEVYQDEIRELPPIRDEALRKPNYAAGMVEERVRNKAGELSKRHYRHVVAAVDEAFRSGGCDLLVVGGHDYEVPAFTGHLPSALRDRLAGTFSADPAAAAPAEIRRTAGVILRRHEEEQGRELAEGVLATLAAGGLAAAGLDDCLWAGSVAAVATLLLADDAGTVPGVVCDNSRWLAAVGDTCPICGRPTRHTWDVIDELAEAVRAEGGQIRHVTGDTRLAEHLVAARLRFALPARPD